MCTAADRRYAEPMDMTRRHIVWTVAAVAGFLLAFQLGLQASDDAGGSGLQFTGDMALWTVAIKGDKTADYEKVLMRLRAALQESDDPERRKQAEGWRVLKVAEPLPDGTIAYVHVISPVVAGADYTLLKPIYDAFPAQSQEIYDLYRGAFAKNLALASGTFIIDMSHPNAVTPPSPPATSTAPQSSSPPLVPSP